MGVGPRGLGLCAIVCVLSATASAQRAADNALTAADDAFGTTVGNESVGLYGPYNARGFSPATAGNIRIEGMYFDQQIGLNNRIVAGSTVHVGISAQSYDFPAPTGIADFRLRKPGDKPITSVFLGYGAYDTLALEIDGQQPVVKEKFSIGYGVGLRRWDNDAASKNFESSFGALARLRPDDESELTGFWGRLSDCRNRQQPLLFTAGPYLPPEIPLRHFYGQSWTKSLCNRTNFGLLGARRLGGGWTCAAQSSGRWTRFRSVRRTS